MNEKRRAAANGKSKGRPSGKRSQSPKKFTLESLTRDKVWKSWIKHLKSRRKPVPLVNVVADCAAHPLKWAVPSSYPNSTTQTLVKTLNKAAAGGKAAIDRAAGEVGPWLKSAELADPTELFAMECLAWCHASPNLAAELNASEWLALIEQLRDLGTSAVGMAVQDQPLVHQQLSGELLLTLAYLYPDLSGTKKLYLEAQRSLSYGIGELLDGEGLPQCRYLPVFRQLLACWTRCSLIGSETGWKCFGTDGQLQYEWLIRQTIGLSRPDGTQIFSPATGGERHTDLLVTAIQHAGDAADEAAAECALPGQHFKQSPRVKSSLPESSIYSPWGETCVMRPKWSRKSPLLAVTWGERAVDLELNTSGELLWSGKWDLQVRVDSQLLEPTTDWDVVCWYSDVDVDYLEIELDLGPDWRLQRQFLLGKLDQFVFLADAVLGGYAADVDYQSSLPLVPDARFHTDDETCEGILWKEKPLASALPLALPEWRVCLGGKPECRS